MDDSVVERQRLPGRSVLIANDQLPAGPWHVRTMPAAQLVQGGLGFLLCLVRATGINTLVIANKLLAIRQIEIKSLTHALSPKGNCPAIEVKLLRSERDCSNNVGVTAYSRDLPGCIQCSYARLTASLRYGDNYAIPNSANPIITLRTF